MQQSRLHAVVIFSFWKFHRKILLVENVSMATSSQVHSYQLLQSTAMIQAVCGSAMSVSKHSKGEGGNHNHSWKNTAHVTDYTQTDTAYHEKTQTHRVVFMFPTQSSVFWKTRLSVIFTLSQSSTLTGNHHKQADHYKPILKLSQTVLVTFTYDGLWHTNCTSFILNCSSYTWQGLTLQTLTAA